MNVTDVRTIKCLVLLPDFFVFCFFNVLTMRCQQREHVQTTSVGQCSCISAGPASGSGYAGDDSFGWIWMKGQLTSAAHRVLEGLD